jgi:hypothetical protein
MHQRRAVARGGTFCRRLGLYANGIAALCWVYPTLIDASLMCHVLVLPPLAPGERERFYQESRLFAGFIWHSVRRATGGLVGVQLVCTGHARLGYIDISGTGQNAIDVVS